jgi:glycosyltransferase involved in cell wall biosynthesis
MVAHTLAVLLAARGHEVRVLTNRFPRSLPVHEVRDGIAVERRLFLPRGTTLLRRGRLDLWLASLWSTPAARRHLHRLMRSFQPDVLNVHFPDVMIPLLLDLRRSYTFRLVVSLHGNDVGRFSGPPWGAPCGRAELGALLRDADAVTACSRDLLRQAEQVEPSVRDKALAIPNGIAPERFLDKQAHAHAKPYVLAVGRLTPVKGHDLLLEALARLGTPCPPVDLLIAGDGEARAGLMAQARQLGLGASVVFLGKTPPDEVVRLLNGCLFAVVPSRAEAFGLVPLEALAAGKPVVATRVGGMGAFLQELMNRTRHSMPCGGRPPVVLVEPNAEALAEGLRACLQARWSRAAQEAVTAVALEEHSWARVVQRYEGVLAGGA